MPDMWFVAPNIWLGTTNHIHPHHLLAMNRIQQGSMEEQLEEFAARIVALEQAQAQATEQVAASQRAVEELKDGLRFS
jgi:hypothetical protein